MMFEQLKAMPPENQAAFVLLTIIQFVSLILYDRKERKRRERNLKRDRSSSN